MRIPKARIHKRGQLCTEYRGQTVYFGKADNPESIERYKIWLADAVLKPRELPAIVKPGQLCTVGHLIEAYLDHAKAYYSPGEYDNLRHAAKVVAKSFSTLLAENFGPLALAKVQAAMVDKGWCRTRINAQVNRVRRMFKWGVSQEVVPPMVLMGLKAVPSLRKGHTTAPERPPVEPVPDSLVDAVLPHLSRTVAAMVRIQRIVGMRSSELCRMRRCDLKADGDLLVFTLSKHKNDHRRKTLVYFLGPQAQAVLADFESKPEEYVFSPWRATKEHHAARAAGRKTKPSPANLRQKRRTDPTKKPGVRYTPNSYRVAVQRGLARYKTTLTEAHAATIPGFHPHQLRHNRSTEIRAAFGLEASRAALGHASIEAAAIYAEADRATARRIALETG